MGFFKKRDPGDITALLLQDMAKVEQVFSHILLTPWPVLSFRGLMALISFCRYEDDGLHGGCGDLGGSGHGGGAEKYRQVWAETYPYPQPRQLPAVGVPSGYQGLEGPSPHRAEVPALEAELKKFKSDSIKLEVAAAGPVMAYLTFWSLALSGFCSWGCIFTFMGA